MIRLHRILRPVSIQRLLRFAGGMLMGAVVGLTLLMGVALLPGLFGFYPLVVLSGSMEPTLNTGDLAVIHRVESHQLQLGDVVSYATPSGSITHRIIGMDITPQGYFFLMRGDANLTTDPRAIPADRVVGKVLYRIPRMGYLVSFVDSGAGRVLFIGLPLVAMVAIWLGGRFKARRVRVSS